MITDFYQFPQALLDLDAQALELCKGQFAHLEEIRDDNQLKMLRAVPAGVSFPGLRLSMVSGALLESLQNSGDTALHRSIPALFLKRKERKAFRETLLNDPYFQAFEH